VLVKRTLATLAFGARDERRVFYLLWPRSLQLAPAAAVAAVINECSRIAWLRVATARLRVATARLRVATARNDERKKQHKTSMVTPALKYYHSGFSMTCGAFCDEFGHRPKDSLATFAIYVLLSLLQSPIAPGLTPMGFFLRVATGTSDPEAAIQRQDRSRALQRIRLLISCSSKGGGGAVSHAISPNEPCSNSFQYRSTAIRTN
jgi:hypothetical protein